MGDLLLGLELVATSACAVFLVKLLITQFSFQLYRLQMSPIGRIAGPNYRGAAPFELAIASKKSLRHQHIYRR